MVVYYGDKERYKRNVNGDQINHSNVSTFSMLITDHIKIPVVCRRIHVLFS